MCVQALLPTRNVKASRQLPEAGVSTVSLWYLCGFSSPIVSGCHNINEKLLKFTINTRHPNSPHLDFWLVPWSRYISIHSKISQRIQRRQLPKLRFQPDLVNCNYYHLYKVLILFSERTRTLLIRICSISYRVILAEN